MKFNSKKMSPQDCKKAFQRFSIAFYLSLIASFFTMVLSTASSLLPISRLFLAVCVTVLCISGVTFYFYVGKLAATLGESPIVWVGGSIVTAPIGPIVVFFVMKRFAIARGWD